jgi:hypothetical protein
MTNSANEDYRLISDHETVEVRQKKDNQQNALYSSKPFSPGEIISEFSAGTISAEPTYLTVQVGLSRHITLQPLFLQYINHSCRPNVFFDTTRMELIALKAIMPNEELVFFYPSTEWIMTQSFRCYCGQPGCLGEIRGAAYLSKQVLKPYRLTDFIQRELAKRTTRKVA